jgi:hypothetical protein
VQTPVFIHAMWRTGGTYLWSRFRVQPAYRAYYEPLHEALATMRDPATAPAHEQARSMPGAKHPGLDTPYFSEFPFAAGGGVEAFDPGCSYERYCLVPGDTDPSLHAYVSHLIAFAAAHEQIPVFKFVRCLLRSRWLAAQFPSRSLLVLRRPIDVWRSFATQGPYYAASICRIVVLNREHPLLAPLAAAYGLMELPASSARADRGLYWNHAVTHEAEMYGLFYEFYLLTCIHGLAHADCVIDMNALGCADARRRVVARLGAHGIDLDLDDASVPTYTDLTATEREWVAREDDLRRQLRARVTPHFGLTAAALATHDGGLSPYFHEVCPEFVCW